MATKTKIEWTDATWNPVRGCTKISPGCKHCYAAAFAERFRGVPGHPYELGFDLRIVPEKLLEPFSWASPNRVFVNSMSDLFHCEIPEEFVRRVAEVMVCANWHTYQVLTKRADRLERMLSSIIEFAALSSHIWWGVSVEDIKHGKPRIDLLRSAPACVRFLSIEPLLEDLGELDLSGIDWVIVGGESGPGARQMKESWVLNVLRACRAQDVPFFFKQWGGVNKKKNGRKLRGRTYDEYPAPISLPMPSRESRHRLMTDLAREFSELDARTKVGIRRTIE